MFFRYRWKRIKRIWGILVIAYLVLRWALESGEENTNDEEKRETDEEENQ